MNTFTPLIVLSTIVALIACGLATAWFVPSLRARIFAGFVKINFAGPAVEAEHVAEDEVKDLQSKAGLDGAIDTAQLLSEKNELEGAGLGSKLKAL